MRETFEELKRYDCREAARRLGLRPDGAGKVTCFLHAGDRHPSLQLYPDGWKCFGCGAHGDTVDLVARYLDLTPGEAAAWLRGENPRAARKKAHPAAPEQGPKDQPREGSGPSAARPGAQVERVHTYPGGRVRKTFYRREDGSKYALWSHLEGDRWQKGRGDWTPALYAPNGIPDGGVCVAEGEKDADTLGALGLPAVSGPDGAGRGKWLPAFTQALAGRPVAIFQDHDQVGRAYAQEVAAALAPVCPEVKVLDLAEIWPEIPQHGDISDLLAAWGAERTSEGVVALLAQTPCWQPQPDPFLAAFKTLDRFERQEAKWLVPGWIPEGQITLLAADGGVGKTTIWCDLITAVSTGKACLLDPPGHRREPRKVAFLSTEDSVRKKLKEKLCRAGAREENILTPDFAGDTQGVLRNLKFGSEDMARFLRFYKPALCVFDPIQGFVPPEVNMGSRNAMRDCMAPLVSLGEETGTTFLVICHTNKRKGAWGRDRVADSADLWDVSRSVLMAGYTGEEGVRYLSNEKNNYAELQQTRLFSIDEGGLIRGEGTAWKRDREYMQEAASNTAAPKREACRAWILQTLEGAGGSMPVKDLEERAKAGGYSFRTLRRAKEVLRDEGQVRFFQTGNGEKKAWHMAAAGLLQELPSTTPTPWTQEAATV